MTIEQGGGALQCPVPSRRDGAMVLELLLFFQAEDGIRDLTVTGVQTCALPILALNERWLDYDQLLQIARACREQVDWDEVRSRTAGSPFARAFFEIVDGLGITGERSEERRVGKSVDLGGRRIIKKKNIRKLYPS